DIVIIGGGIAGLATAAWLEHDHGARDLCVVEASERAGGKVFSSHSDGHVLEWGPQGFLDNAPDTLELARREGLGGALLRADDAAADRFIARRGRLRKVPMSPPAFLTSDVLPVSARMRVLAEILGRQRPAGDESVFNFARRRIGEGAAEVLVDAMVTGVYAGDSRQLSLAATFPRMAAMEEEHGSLTRALFAKRRQARTTGAATGGPSGPGGTLTTFEDGMGQLPVHIAERLADRLFLETPVRRLERTSSGFRLSGDDLEIEAEKVVLAVPAHAASGLVGAVAPAAVDPLASIPTAPIAVVMTSYRDPGAFGRPVRGFGFLVPGCEPLGILGCLYCHDIFPAQAPSGRLLLRTMLGGARDPSVLDLDDDALLSRVRTALKAMLGGDPEPDLTWIVRHPRGIAQYTLGHLDRVAAAERATGDAGLVLVGSSYHGVSVNDCIRQARATAARIADRAAQP
ncbi:MAG: protoporphyrinogen oxidase, partial [Acidobacteria bacterium]|nr:protoporphyrinogen oxidase [Acidobacteriota bacterium]